MPTRSRAADQEVARARTTLTAALDELRAGLLVASGEVDVAAKADGTPVTDADLHVDERLTDRLLDAFPTHAVLSEERATRAPDADWTWILDPIDGTSNFTCRLPYWSISVALALEGEPVLGVVDAPVLGRRYLATHGQGASIESRTTSLDGRAQQPRRRPLAVRSPVDWRDRRNRHVPVMLTSGTARRVRDAGLRLNPRVMGSTALDLAVVAEGAAVASLATIPRVWDVAAGILLVREAGGVVLTLRGDELLPLTPGVEQRDRTGVVAAGPREAWLRDLTAGLLPA